MLLRFRAANTRSLRDEQELSFVAASDADAADGCARSVRLSDGKLVYVYPVIGIFGANASGKSNVMRALGDMRSAVLHSYARWASQEQIPREVFALDPQLASEVSFYEVDFVTDDGVRWTYGFELGSERVEGEWLFSYPRGRRQVWFDRDAARGDVVFPGDRIADRRRLAETTRSNSLLLSRAATDNHPQLTPIYEWFRSNLRALTDHDVQTSRQLQDPMLRGRVEELLRVADVGIQSVGFDEELGRPVFVHAAAGAESVAFDWLSESLGTQMWFTLLGPLLAALDRGTVLGVDELDSSLHPRLVAEVVRLFGSPVVNSKGAQLVFTAHDPSLLQSPSVGRLLEPGQVWITEKDDAGRTSLFPITDLEPGDEEDLMQSYLAGSFGGVPRVSEGQVGRRLLRAGTLEAGQN